MRGTSLLVQWVGLHAPNAGGLVSIPGQGIRSRMHATIKSVHAATKNVHAVTKKSTCRNKGSRMLQRRSRVPQLRTNTA